MIKMKKGFTLIELLVVIAIIGILATAITPRLREQLSKAKDAKAIALLGTARTTVEVILLEKIIKNDINKNNYILISLNEIKNKLDKKSNDMFDERGEGNVLVGSILDKNDEVQENWGAYLFGTDDRQVNKLKLKTNLNKLRIKNDEVELSLMVGNDNGKQFAKSTNGKLWADY